MSANLMSAATLSQPHSPTPLDYINPNPDNPFDPEPSHEPEGNPVDDNGNPHGPDGPDGAPDPGDPDDNDDGDRFIEALMHLLGSLKDL